MGLFNSDLLQVAIEVTGACSHTPRRLTEGPTPDFDGLIYAVCATLQHI